MQTRLKIIPPHLIYLLSENKLVIIAIIKHRQNNLELELISQLIIKTIHIATIKYCIP